MRKKELVKAFVNEVVMGMDERILVEFATDALINDYMGHTDEQLKTAIDEFNDELYQELTNE